jgi:hypothetical protein
MINNKDTLISYQSSRYAVKTRNHWDIWSRKGPCIRFGRVFRAQADKPTPLKLGDLMKLVHAIQLASFRIELRTSTALLHDTIWLGRFRLP